MNILVIAATVAEIAPSIKHIGSGWNRLNELFFEKNGIKVQFAVTGVGMLETAYNLTKLLAKDSYDLVVQAGIGGSYDTNISIGEVVNVVSDQYGDLGAEDGQSFLDVFELSLLDANGHPYNNKVIGSTSLDNGMLSKLKKCTGVTVSKVTGSEETKNAMLEKYTCDVESMEGVACHYICAKESVDFVQLRAISNYVELRNKENWNIPLAITRLNDFLIVYLQEF